MSRIRVSVAPPYEVTVECGALDRLGQLLSPLAEGAVCIVTDTNIAPLYLQRTQAALSAAGFSVCTAVLPAGEQAKCFSRYAELVERFAGFGLCRSDTVLALGGGVVCDLAGFAAATYLRGVRFASVPTDLLAMTDASVGGKTAIDLPAGKNLVGAFYQPSLVVCDPTLLSTLPLSELQNGCGEVVKTAVLFDRALFAHLEDSGLAFDRTEIVERCIAHKAAVVSRDPYDTGERRLLNLGHTVGHAIERLSGYTVAHGAAVSIGTAVMARAFCADAARIEALLSALGLPSRTPYSAEALAEAALCDKKRCGTHLTLVVPLRIGQCELRSVPIAELAALIKRGL